MITIVEKLRPFSHGLGTSCLIPKTSFEVEVYPTLVRIYDIQTGVRVFVKEEEIPIIGPLKDFTVVQDLERGVVTVFGKDLFYHINSDLTVSYQKKPPSQELLEKERLFLGMHKQQDWDALKKRRDFREIFPLWHRLGNLASLDSCLLTSGMFSLLDDCKRVIEEHRPEKIIPAFEKLFLAGFRSLLVPRLEDDDYQGILKQEPVAANPLHLLSSGYRLIQSLFVDSRKEGVYILPNVPPEFFAGKLMNVSVAPYGMLSIEWTKKMVRRMSLQSTYNGLFPLVFHSSVKRCCIRHHEKERGFAYTCNTPLEISSNQIYLFDRFEK